MTSSLCQFMKISILWGVLGVSICCAAPVLAQEPLPADAESSAENAVDLRDPEALAELTRAIDFLEALPRFHIQARVARDVIQEDGRRLQFEKRGDIYLQRPDRFFAEVFLDDGRHRQFWYEGKTLSFAEPTRNLHTQIKAPTTIDATLDMLEGLLKDPMPLADILYSDLTPLEQRAIEADLVGDSLINGRACTQLAFRGETVDWQLWIERGEKPFIRKLSISYRDVPGVPQFTAWIDVWETPDQFPEDLFNFTVPTGSEFIEFLMPMPRLSEEGGQS